MSDTLAHRLTWACAALCFVNACAFAWLGLSYVITGTGLHPVLAGLLVVVGACGCWLFAREADEIARETDAEAN